VACCGRIVKQSERARAVVVRAGVRIGHPPAEIFCRGPMAWALEVGMLRSASFSCEEFCSHGRGLSRQALSKSLSAT
jgi:hypothetical protein